MVQEQSADETTVLATYSNRQNAEVSKARLAERGIDAFIVADNVHPPFQLTEGAKLCVLEGAADRARGVLEEETSGSAECEIGVETPPESAQQEQNANLTFGSGAFVQATAWTYVAAFLLMVAIVLTGLLISL